VKVLDAAEMVVVQLKLPGAEPAPTAIPADAGAAGPEVIKKEKKAEDEDEKK
jgi:Ni,Fe-hydrogenase III small subunit